MTPVKLISLKLISRMTKTWGGSQWVYQRDLAYLDEEGNLKTVNLYASYAYEVEAQTAILIKAIDKDLEITK